MKPANPGHLGRGFRIAAMKAARRRQRMVVRDPTPRSAFATFRRVGEIRDSGKSRQIGQITVGLDDFCTPFELSSLAIRA
jgi:hypothetical protein